MRDPKASPSRGRLIVALRAVFWLMLVLRPTGARAQSPDEHASHHPGQSSGAAPVSSPMSPGGMATGGGMMDQMGEMMKGMGKPPAKELYPSLMALPELSATQRKQVDEQAGEQMRAGAALMAQAFDALNAGTQSGDYAAMQDAMARLREGAAQLDSGIAARRALAEGRAPRAVALDWFKQEMNLETPKPPDEPRTILAVTPFHLFTMVLLIGFALAMVAMYFFKMRRAAALFGRIDPDDGRSPPGAPSAGITPPSGGPPPPGGTLASSGLTPPSPSSTSAPVSAPTSTATPPSSDLTAGSSSAADSVATLVSPVTKNWRGKLRVGSIVRETPSVKTFRLLPLSNDPFLPFTFVPGQFLNVAFGIGGARMNRSYSISSSPNRREYVDLTVRREPRGAVSRHIVDLLKVGDQIETGGPVGRFTFTGAEADSIVLISGGVGITPMVSITRYLTEQSWPGEIYFIYTCRTPADFIFSGEVAALERRNPNVHVAVTISKAEGTDWKGHRGRISKEWLAETVPDLASRRIHLCGPPSMMDTTKAILSELEVPPGHIETEAFGAIKPTPAAPGTTAKPTAPATGPVVKFSKNNKSAKIRLDLQAGDSPPKQTILELSEELGIGIEFSCRVGTCGVCKVKMTSGEVDQEVQDALDADDKTNGIILACQAKPTGDVAVDA